MGLGLLRLNPKTELGLNEDAICAAMTGKVTDFESHWFCAVMLIVLPDFSLISYQLGIIFKMRTSSPASTNFPMSRRE
jgi:hypothetical protein